MRLGYFTMPVHPMGRDWSQTLREDREAVILADKLGFHDAFMGEHLTDACETITNSMLFHATLIHDTKQIKLATGTRISRRCIRYWSRSTPRCSIIWRRAIHPGRLGRGAHLRFG